MYLVLGQACLHLGLMEDAILLLQTGKRLATASHRRSSSSLFSLNPRYKTLIERKKERKKERRGENQSMGMGEEVKNEDEEEVQPMKKLKQQQPPPADDDFINEKTGDHALAPIMKQQQQQQDDDDDDDDDLVVDPATSLFDIDSQDDDDDNDDEYGATSTEDDDETLVVDRKGKGIMIEKPNPTMLLHSSSDSSDDDDTGLSDHSVDVLSDDDPLAEVDLDNILPSRTRTGRSATRTGGVRISNNPDNN